MSIARFELTRATTLHDACAILADPAGGAMPLAGGTQLLMALRNGTQAARRLVDLSAIAGFDRLSCSTDTGLEIGAGVTLARLAATRFVQKHYPALVAAAQSVGTLQLRTMGTVGGNLCQDTCCIYVDRGPDQRGGLAPCHKIEGHHCHVVRGSEACWANYAGDLAPILVAWEATLTVCDADQTRTRPLETLFSREGVHPIALAPGELIAAVHVPPPAPLSGAAYLKLRQRESLDYPLLGVAAAVAADPDGTCTSARVVLTGVNRGPVVVSEANLLVGQRPTDALIDRVADAAAHGAHPVKNAWGYVPSYRVKMTRPFVTRALRDALAQASERGGLHD